VHSSLFKYFDSQLQYFLFFRVIFAKIFFLKKVLLTILPLMFFFSSYAQKEKPFNLPKLDAQIVHFGYSLGLNTMDFVIRPSDRFLTQAIDTIYGVEVGRFVGFNINIISNFRIANYVDFRFTPGLVFGQRNLHYKHIYKGEIRRHTMMIESTFVDLPIQFKYKAARISNWRPFLTAGASARIDMASQKKIKPEEYPKIRLRRFDVYYEIGTGVDFFLEYFMFGIELKASWGILNDVVYDGSQYASYFKRLNSRMLLICFNFEGGKLDFIKKHRK